MKQATATITDNHLFPLKPHLSGNRILLNFQLMRLNCPQIAQEAKPGQFVMVNCGEECTLPRPLSIHQVNDGKVTLWIATWEDGKGTHWLAQRQVGNNIDLFGPLGNGYSIHPESHKLLLLAGGIGIAPLYFLAQEAKRKQCSVILIHGASKATHLYPKELPAEIRIVTVTEDGTAGKKGMITDLLPDFVDWADQIFACGPIAMYKSMATQKLLKAKPVQVSLEVRMGCGRGVCYGCTVKTKRGLKQVCQDGPVFDLDDVLWKQLSY